jgi:hypothetical protein
VNDGIGNDMKKAVMTYFNALSQHGLVETEKTIKQRPQSRFPASMLKIEARNFCIQGRSFDH